MEINKFVSRKLEINIITLFPELFAPFLEWSMIKKAQKIKALSIKIHNLRSWSIDKRGTVDDRPYSGGPGMLIRPEPVYNALKELASDRKNNKEKIILLSPKGKLFNQKLAQKLTTLDRIILVCGHYEGVDERIRKHMVDDEISIGNYVLSGGEIPAMVVVDSISRLLPGVLEKEDASEIESFSPGLKKLTKNDKKTDLLLEYPQYTRPPVFKGWKVPKTLLSGNHQKIAKWRIKKVKTKKKK